MSGRRVTLELLESIVDSEIWKQDRRLLTWIFNEFTELTAEAPELAQNFGTAEFWTAVLGKNFGNF